MRFVGEAMNIGTWMRIRLLHLTENLRIEESELKKLDTIKVCEYSAAYHSTNIKKLCSLLRRL